MEITLEVIVIAKDFNVAPGARNVFEGDFSGEDFLNKILLPKFKKAVEEKSTVLVDLDNTEGYATSFLEEAFGGLARMFDSQTVLNHIEFKSDDEPLLIDEIKMYIKEAKS